jgi:hypothetical protein
MFIESKNDTEEDADEASDRENEGIQVQAEDAENGVDAVTNDGSPPIDPRLLGGDGFDDILGDDGDKDKPLRQGEDWLLRGISRIVLQGTPVSITSKPRNRQAGQTASGPGNTVTIDLTDDATNTGSSATAAEKLPQESRPSIDFKAAGIKRPEAAKGVLALDQAAFLEKFAMLKLSMGETEGVTYIAKPPKESAIKRGPRKKESTTRRIDADQEPQEGPEEPAEGQSRRNDTGLQDGDQVMAEASQTDG